MSYLYAYNAITGKLDLVSVTAAGTGNGLLLESGDSLLLESGTDVLLMET